VKRSATRWKGKVSKKPNLIFQDMVMELLMKM